MLASSSKTLASRATNSIALPLAVSLAILVALVATLAPASAHGFRVLYAFCAQSNCTDGKQPSALSADTSGNLYGTTHFGGAHNFGTVFELKRRANGRYKLEVLYSFCSQANCKDGALPDAAVIIDTLGNVYGTTTLGGDLTDGAVYEFERRSGKLKVLYSFCPGQHDCVDGVGAEFGLTYAGAASGALYDGTSPLYGTTTGGGAGQFGGVAYQLTPAAHSWTYQVIYSFCSLHNCMDGNAAMGPLLPDIAGNLYGVTQTGGGKGRGTVFKLSPSGGIWSEAVLYSFCQQTNCADGEEPGGGLAIDAAGNLFGSTVLGGNACNLEYYGSCGVSFKLAPGGQESVLHAFCANVNCADGAIPDAAPVIDANGNLFGTTRFGGDVSSDADGAGLVWRLSGKSLRTLHVFCKNADCSKGSVPIGGLISDASGNLFGTTYDGGPADSGVVYEITP